MSLKSAAKLANAVAFEYLRGQLLQQATEAYAAGDREMTEISSLYGVHHPAYLSGQMKLEGLRRRLTALREGTFDEAVASRVTGQSFVAAQKVMIPSGPNILLVLGLTVVAALGVGIWLAMLGWLNKPSRIRLALLSWRNKPPRSNGFATLGERTFDSVRKLMRLGDGRRTSDRHRINDREVGGADHPRLDGRETGISPHS